MRIRFGNNVLTNPGYFEISSQVEVQRLMLSFFVVLRVINCNEQVQLAELLICQFENTQSSGVGTPIFRHGTNTNTKYKYLYFVSIVKIKTLADSY